MQRFWPHALFVPLSRILFSAATLISGATARTRIGDGDPSGIFAFPWPLDDGALHILFFAAPFLLLGCLCGTVTRRSRLLLGALLFVVGGMWLVWLYFTGIQASIDYLNERAWTASALAQGLLPFKGSLGIAGGTALLCWLYARRTRS